MPETDLQRTQIKVARLLSEGAQTHNEEVKLRVASTMALISSTEERILRSDALINLLRETFIGSACGIPLRR